MRPRVPESHATIAPPSSRPPADNVADWIQEEEAAYARAALPPPSTSSARP